MTNEPNQSTADGVVADDQATGTQESAGAVETTAAVDDQPQTDAANQPGGDAGGTANGENQESGSAEEEVVSVERKRQIREALAVACGIQTGNAWTYYQAMSPPLQARVCEIIDAKDSKSINGDLRKCLVDHHAEINRAAAEDNKAVVDGVNDAD